MAIRALALSALCVVLGAGPARASAQETQAKERYREAQKQFDLGRFEVALEGYSSAYEALPLPAFLFNIGQCHRQLGHYEKAAFFYGRYLALMAKRPENAEVVEELIREMHQAQTKQEREQEARPPAPELKPAPVLVTPPTPMPAPPPAIAPAPTPAPSTTLGTGQLAPVPEAQPELIAPLVPPHPHRRWAWIPGAGALVAGGAAAVLLVDSKVHYDALGQNGALPMDPFSYGREGSALQTGGLVALGVGAAALAGAATLFFMGGDAAPTVAVLPGGASVGVTGALP